MTKAVGPKAKGLLLSLDVNVMVCPPMLGAMLIVLLPPAAFAALTAARKLPAPLSAVLVTLNEAGASRSSSNSSCGR
jgi:hypothetical protein